VVAASGMVTGGRILSYLEPTSSPETTKIIVGYKSRRYKGRKLLEGTKKRIYGKYYPLGKILEIGLSAHTDQKGLLNQVKTNLKSILSSW
jgi:metallo-beta-lactamase family protein